jgi:hypothetical protein
MNDGKEKEKTNERSDATKSREQPLSPQLSISTLLSPSSISLLFHISPPHSPPPLRQEEQEERHFTLTSPY